MENIQFILEIAQLIIVPLMGWIIGSMKALEKQLHELDKSMSEATYNIRHLWKNFTKIEEIIKDVNRKT